jgi:hypothetical protein
MPDPANELKRTHERFIDRVRESWQAATGIELPHQFLLPGNPGAAFVGTAPMPDTSGTGYDGTETTVAFMFGISEFGSADLLT